MSGNAHIKAFFDRLAPVWIDREEEAAARDALVERMAIPEGSVIADIGCGKGVMETHLLRREPRGIVAIDLSEEMIAAAHERYNDLRVQFLCGDFLELDLPVFDAAVIFNAYPHFLDKPALVQKLTENVRSGGIVSICHSASREVINSRHDNHSAPAVSTLLRPAAEEAAEFAKYFEVNKCEENEESYFIRLVRK